MAYKRYYQLVTMSYEGTTIEATCFTQDTQPGGFRHGLTSIRVFYSDGSSKIHNRTELGLQPFEVHYLNITWEERRKYDSLFFSLFDMLFNRKGWDTKEHHKQVLNVIKNGSRVYKDLQEI